MKPTPTAPTQAAPVRSTAELQPARLFYLAAAALFVVLMLVGFQQFYFHGRSYPGREIPPPIRTLLIMHGVAMAGWVALFFLQPLLIVGRKRRVHMMVGRVGAVLAACIFILGLKVGVESTRINPPQMKIWSLSPKQFMAVPIISVTVFTAFVALGVWNRRRADIHRPMMLLSILAVMPAAVSRIDPINSLYVGTVWETVFGPFFATMVIGLVLLVTKWLVTRSFDRWFAIGYAALVLASVLTMRVATTGAWDRFAGFLLR